MYLLRGLGLRPHVVHLRAVDAGLVLELRDPPLELRPLAHDHRRTRVVLRTDLLVGPLELLDRLPRLVWVGWGWYGLGGDGGRGGAWYG